MLIPFIFCVASNGNYSLKWSTSKEEDTGKLIKVTIECNLSRELCTESNLFRICDLWSTETQMDGEVYFRLESSLPKKGRALSIGMFTIAL